MLVLTVDRGKGVRWGVRWGVLASCADGMGVMA